MAFILKLKDNTNTVDFMTSSFALDNGGLKIKALKKKQQWGANSPYVHGSRLVSYKYDNREIEISFTLSGSTRDILIENGRKITTILENAMNRSVDKRGSRVELQYQWDGATNVTYFEVIDGTFSWVDNVWSVEQLIQVDRNGNYFIHGQTLSLTVKPFATKISPVSGTPSAITVSNVTGSGTSILALSYDFGSVDNYVEFADTQINGDFPAKLKVKLILDAGYSLFAHQKIFLGLRKDNLNFKSMWFSTEAGYVRGDGGASTTEVADAECSNGYYRPATIIWDGVTTTKDVVAWSAFSIGGSFEPYRGTYRVFAKAQDGWSVDMHFRISITTINSGYVLFTGDWVKGSDTFLIDLGTLRLPIGDLPHGFKIWIDAYDPVAHTKVIKIDSLVLFPIDDGLRIFQMSGGEPVVETDRVYDDTWNDLFYSTNSTDGASGHMIAYLPPLEAVPDKTHRLYILTYSATNDALENSNGAYIEISPIEHYDVVA